MVPTRTSPSLYLLLRRPTHHHLVPLSIPNQARSISHATPPRGASRSVSSLNLLSKYAPQPAASAPSPGLPITQPILQDVVSSIPVAVKNVLPEVVVKKDLVPLVSFERSGDREERQPGDDKFEVEGIKVPERPLKPGEEDCCMSGCVHCVYDLYAASVLDYQAALASAHAALLASGRPQADWPGPIRARAERGLGAEVEVVLEEDPAAKAFREMEERMMKKKSG